MPTWGWILIARLRCAIVAIVHGDQKKRQTKQLQSQFGPEYDRTIESAGQQAEGGVRARRAAGAARAARHPAAVVGGARAYADAVADRPGAVRRQPGGAVASADQLIQSVMRDRGYPVDDFDSRAADVSVDHPQVVENYREGHRLAQQSANGNGSTEELRQAMRHYRALFDELVEPDGDADRRRRASARRHDDVDAPSGHEMSDTTFDERSRRCRRRAGSTRSAARSRGRPLGAAAGSVCRRTRESLLQDDQAERYRNEWQQIQAGFVDEPRKSVEEADRLVADLMQRLAAVFSDERERLEKQWDSGDDVSTEDLRVGLTRYRSFFDRLLST